MITLSHYFIPLHIHYIFFYALSLILGIWWQATAHSYVCAGAIIGALLVGSALIRQVRIIPMTLLYMLGFFALGALSYIHSTEQFRRFATTYNREVCDVRARVCDVVEVENRQFNKVITLDVIELQHGLKGDWQQTRQCFKLYTRAEFNAHYNDIVEIHSLKLSFPEQGDFRNYLIKEGISATLFPRKLDYTIISSSSNLWTWIYTTRKRIYQSCKQKMSDVTFALFSTIFLGNKTVADEHLNHYKNHFKFWGISHYLARSGLHLVIFLIILQFLLSFIPLRYTTKQIIMLSIIIMYAVLSWSSISFIRALYTIVLYQLCNIVTVPIAPLHLLSLITMSILLISPLQLFFLDFQLSFGLTCALALLNVIVKQHKVGKSKN